MEVLGGQFDANPAETRELMRGELEGTRAAELTDEVRVAGLPT